MEKIKERLKSLCALGTVSGHERLIDVLTGEEKAFLDKIEYDKIGSLLLVKKSNKPNAKKILIDAHIDIVGFMVTEVLEGGFLRFVNIGGLDTRVLPSTHVCVFGKEKINGVITSTPPHLRVGGVKVPKIEELLIDTGIPTDELKELVSIGDIAMYKPYFTELQNNYVCAVGLDDKSCACAILDFITSVDKGELEYDVYASLSAQEETGKCGPARLAFDIDPDIAITTDVNFASGEGIKERESIECEKGASVDISSLTNRSLTRNIIKLLKDKGIEFQLVCEPSYTGTNNDALSISGKGIRTALMSIPLKAMHSPSEIVNLKDIKSLSRMLKAVCCAKELL
ncbi:MAG: hypothetical protein IJW54_05520 [Clostridia bacterium]|nr:hypothetical protein [Clostridia bacterium]